MRNFTNRFSQKKVAQWAIAYLAISWIALQVLQLLWEVFEWPLTPLRITIAVAALGFPVTVILAWVRQPTVDEQSAGLPLASAPALIEALQKSSGTPVGTGATISASGPWSALSRPVVAVPAVVTIGALGLWAALALDRGADATWAREEAIPQMLAMIEQDEYAAAFILAEEIERVIPNDPVLADAWDAASVSGSIVTEPAGADVWVRPYADQEAEWRLLGQSPIESIRLPRSESVALRVEKDGFEPLLLGTGVPGFYFGRTEVIELHDLGTIPGEMVYIPGGDFPVRITGFNSGGGGIPLDAFLIDRHEVTNAEYKEFVDAGGYQTAEFWEGLDFVEDGQRLSHEAALAAFVDATGQPGPATWEFGDFPNGAGAYPVGGASWYEAVAYLRFRGKSLPTIYHWARAALEPHSNSQPLSSAMLPLANFGGAGPQQVGVSGALASHGTYDMAGNVAEWAWNESGDHRWLLGGAWDDDTRMYSVRFTTPPFDRGSRHGFRGVRYLGDAPAEDLFGAVELQPRDFRDAVAVSDEVYALIRSQMAYVPSALNMQHEGVDESAEDWVREHVTVDVGYEDERMSVYLFLPKNVEPPYATFVYFPGLGPFISQPAEPSAVSFRLRPGGHLRTLLQSGRAVAWPVWKGSYERWDDFISLTGDQYLRTFGTRMKEWAEDLGRTIDYLESRDDIRSDQIGYTGASFGASTSLALLALEERLTGALLLLPGFTYRDLPPEADAVNHVPRVTMPVLMIGGKYDYVFPVETAQQPLFDQLGTPDEDKIFLLYEMGHGPFPRGQTMRDMLPWLDKYFGPGN